MEPKRGILQLAVCAMTIITTHQHVNTNGGKQRTKRACDISLTCLATLRHKLEEIDRHSLRSACDACCTSDLGMTRAQAKSTRRPPPPLQKKKTCVNSGPADMAISVHCRLSSLGSRTRLFKRSSLRSFGSPPLAPPPPPSPVLLHSSPSCSYSFSTASACMHAWEIASSNTYVSIRQHTSAYVSIRQHTSAYVSIRLHASAWRIARSDAYVSIRQHTSAYVSIRTHSSA
jgi:hypothetical protein